MLYRKNIKSGIFVQNFFFTLTLVSFYLASAILSAQPSVSPGIGLSEAVQISLKKNPSILLASEQVIFNEASLQRASGVFDLQLTSSFVMGRERTPLLQTERVNGINELITDLTNYSLNITKLLRSGISLSTNIQMNRITDQFRNSTTPNYAGINFLVQIPLLKGRGEKVVAANETAAKYNYENSILNRYHTTSQIVYNTVRAYWNFVAAAKQLEILTESEKRSRELVNETQILVDAGERPEAELQQPLANLADKTALRISAEQTFYEARQNLGVVIGLPSDEILKIQFPVDKFPQIVNTIDSLGINHLIEKALQNRADLLASKNTRKSTRVLWEAAISNTRPQVDLNFKLGYTGLDEGKNPDQIFTAFSTNRTGANISTTLKITLPTKSFYGAALQQNSQYQQSVIRSKDLSRTIRSEVLVAINDLKQSAHQLAKSQEAITLYRTAVQNEEQKLQQGLSTIIELLFTEDRLTNALLNMTSAELNYANAIANLRFQTGTLLTITEGEISVPQKNLTTIPLNK